MDAKRRIVEVVRRLKEAYPRARIALEYSNPFELLVATILSAQCTDARVNIVTASLFKKYKNMADYARADIKELQKDVRSTGFFRNKADNIKKSARMIIERFGGRVPDTMKDILELPGVARKTANIVLGNAYGIVEGIAVDTHVIRIAALLGFTRNINPEKIEQDLMKIVSPGDWLSFSYLIQTLGRDTCKARKPDHGRCVLKNICPSARA